jgi:hypothetical protein
VCIDEETIGVEGDRRGKTIIANLRNRGDDPITLSRRLQDAVYPPYQSLILKLDIKEEIQQCPSDVLTDEEVQWIGAIPSRDCERHSLLRFLPTMWNSCSEATRHIAHKQLVQNRRSEAPAL